MSNRERGEVTLQAGERQVKLALTLGALAEIEEAFQVESIQDLGTRLQKPKIKDLLEILRCLSMGGGEEHSVVDLKKMPINVNDAKDAIMKVLALANPDAGEPADPTKTPTAPAGE